MTPACTDDAPARTGLRGKPIHVEKRVFIKYNKYAHPDSQRLLVVNAVVVIRIALRRHVPAIGNTEGVEKVAGAGPWLAPDMWLVGTELYCVVGMVFATFVGRTRPNFQLPSILIERSRLAAGRNASLCRFPVGPGPSCAYSKNLFSWSLK
jgi:hypothetical protein